MNAMYQERQTSGNRWLVPATIMPHHADQRPPFLPKSKQGLDLLANDKKQMAEFAAEYEATLNEVRRYFVLPADPAQVLTFLSGHRTIPQILLQAATPLRACFGADAVFSLRAPIDESGSQSLYAVVMWPGNLQDVRQALETFDDTWWLAQSRQASGYITFTYELV